MRQIEQFALFPIAGLYLLITISQKAKAVITSMAGKKVIFLANMLVCELFSLFTELNQNNLGCL